MWRGVDRYLVRVRLPRSDVSRAGHLTNRRSLGATGQCRGMSQLTDAITKLPADWHLAGSLSNPSLVAIERHTKKLAPLVYSVETGCGKSTLLLSHLSQHHVVFTLG